MNHMNRDEFFDKVHGCWMGKNIGGTLGAPMEGKPEINAVDFYLQDLKKGAVPNDDLDLQLVWFQAVKQYGLSRITPKVLAEYWISVVNGPWNEYGVGRTNLKMGLLPPLSGACNNERWKWSNGAWIRSEIWACLAPGDPDRAIEYAYMDACVDHAGDGIYAELFTAALESAAFVVSDLRTLIRIGLSKIPAECRTARCVSVAVAQHEAGKDWKAAREAVLRESADLGWFQAPANIGFTVIGLLYGGGDFGKSVCLAVNCGDDTDCTGATAGAVLGIIQGRKALPAKWTEPVGESIVNVCITPFMGAPKTLTDLATQVAEEAIHQGSGFLARAHGRALGVPPLTIGDGPTSITPALLARLPDSAAAAKIWARSPYVLDFEVPGLACAVDYIDGPQVSCGVEKKIKVRVGVDALLCLYEKVVSLEWRLPPGWSMPSGQRREVYLGSYDSRPEIPFTLVPGPMAEGFTFLELVVRENGRRAPTILAVPFQDRETVQYSHKEAIPIKI